MELAKYLLIQMSVAKIRFMQLMHILESGKLTDNNQFFQVKILMKGRCRKTVIIKDGKMWVKKLLSTSHNANQTQGRYKRSRDSVKYDSRDDATVRLLEDDDSEESSENARLT